MSWRKRIRIFMGRNMPVILERLDLTDDLAASPEIIESVRQGIELKGPNLWILMLAVLIASVGLNVNSIAVIIGAMLISPVMGPIIGMGTAVALLDTRMLRYALKNLGFAVGFSVLASTLYFSLSPLSGAQSELLARTSPSIWDVLIALGGGVAGMIGFTRTTKTNVIPGVAIATALLPPLCTAGFGLSRLDPTVFFGAFYLFFINAVFICLGTYFICRLVGLHDDSTEVTSLWLRRGLLGLALVTVLPSLWVAYRLVTEEIHEKQVRTLLSSELGETEGTMLQTRRRNIDGKRVLELVLVGVEDTEVIEKRLNEAAARHGLRETKIRVVDAINRQDERSLAANGKLLQTLYLKSEEALKAQFEETEKLRAALQAAQTIQLPVTEIEREAQALFSTVRTLKIGLALGTLEGEKRVLAWLQSTNKLTTTQRRTLTSWLKTRTQATHVHLIEERVLQGRP